MQIGVDPRAGRVVDVLRDLVRAFPVAFGVVPERDERGAHRRRCLSLERGVEFCKGHCRRTLVRSQWHWPEPASENDVPGIGMNCHW